MGEDVLYTTESLRISTDAWKEDDDVVTFKAVLTKEGVMNGGYKPGEEIKKSYRWLENVPITDEHPKNRLGIVISLDEAKGYVDNVELRMDGNGRPEVVANLNIFKTEAELIDKIRSGKKVEVSVGFWYVREDSTGAFAGMKYDHVQRNLYFDHVAIVERGACSREQGCGIMGRVDELVHEVYKRVTALIGRDIESQKQDSEDDSEPALDGSVPGNPSGYKKADISTPWSRPSLGDFTSKSWNELSESEKRNIARHFAWAASMPPEKFGDLKLPHHRPKDGAVVWRGVVAAYAALEGARGGVNIPEADKGAVLRHLRAHASEFGKSLGEDVNIVSPVVEEDNQEVGRMECEHQKEIDELKTALEQVSAERDELKAKLEVYERAEQERIAKERDALVTEIVQVTGKDAKTFENFGIEELRVVADLVKAGNYVIKGDGEEPEPVIASETLIRYEDE